MSSKTFVRLILVGSILALPLLAWIYFSKKAQTPEEYAAKQFAKHTGLSGEELLLILRTNDKIRTKQIDDRDWGVIEKYSNSPAIEFRANSELALPFLKGTPYEARARAVLHRLAQDTDPGTRSVAIQAMFKSGDPQAQSSLEEAQQSTDPAIKSEADRIAKIYSGKKSL